LRKGKTKRDDSGGKKVYRKSLTTEKHVLHDFAKVLKMPTKFVKKRKAWGGGNT